ncbi:Glyoxalase-like domain protein [compost metagenome]
MEAVKQPVLVRDYDQAIAFYTEKLGFRVDEDVQLSEQERWVVLSRQNQLASTILLTTNELKQELSGRLFLYTDNMEESYRNLLNAGVSIIQEPEEYEHGTLAVFTDPWGNHWELIKQQYDSKR